MIEYAFLTAERLRELLHYDPLTGVFTWKVTRSNNAPAGTVCDYKSHGYVSVRIDYMLYGAHRLAWLYMTGEWPANEVDHKDNCILNNKWENLRQATKLQNRRNMGFRKKQNTSGYKGVSWCSRLDMWVAQIGIDYGSKYIACGRDPKELAKKYDEAATRYFGEFARTNASMGLL